MSPIHLQYLRPRSTRARLGATLLAGTALLLAAAPAAAAEFSLYLKCQGKASAGGKTTPSHLDLALRDNNQTALIQRSNALPVGERLKYNVSPITYSMTYRVPGTGSAVFYDWWRGSLFVWQPSLKRVSMVRVSIDRQTGNLSGELLNAEDQQLGSLSMACEAIEEDALPAPKF